MKQYHWDFWGKNAIYFFFSIQSSDFMCLQILKSYWDIALRESPVRNIFTCLTGTIDRVIDFLQGEWAVMLAEVTNALGTWHSQMLVTHSFAVWLTEVYKSIHFLLQLRVSLKWEFLLHLPFEAVENVDFKCFCEICAFFLWMAEVLLHNIHQVSYSKSIHILCVSWEF